MKSGNYFNGNNFDQNRNFNNNLVSKGNSSSFRMMQNPNTNGNSPSFRMMQNGNGHNPNHHSSPVRHAQQHSSQFRSFHAFGEKKSPHAPPHSHIHHNLSNPPSSQTFNNNGHGSGNVSHASSKSLNLCISLFLF